MLNVFKTSSPLIKSTVDAFKEISPELIQKCPYFGRYEVTNVHVNKNSFLMLPSGLYRFSANATDAFSKAMLVTSMLLEITD